MSGERNILAVKDSYPLQEKIERIATDLFDLK